MPGVQFSIHETSSMHFQYNSMRTAILCAVVELIPIHLQIPRVVRLDEKLGNTLFGALEPFTHNLACTGRGQGVRVVVLDDGGFVVPGGTAVD